MNSINFPQTKLIQISEKYCPTTINNINPFVYASVFQIRHEMHKFCKSLQMSLSEA